MLSITKPAPEAAVAVAKSSTLSVVARAVQGVSSFLSELRLLVLASRFRSSFRRYFYPSVGAVRRGGGEGFDGLMYIILNDQCVTDTGAPLPKDISLPELATVRASLLPRAFSRPEIRLTFEQTVVGPLHVRLVEGDYRIGKWVRAHDPTFWHRAGRWLLRHILRRRGVVPDPADTLRLAPEEFSCLVFRNLWAVPELEATLASTIPDAHGNSASATSGTAAPERTAMSTLMRLQTDHEGWAEPAPMLRGLHVELSAALVLEPDSDVLMYGASRVSHAVHRVDDFDQAYELAAAQEPPPDWLTEALDVVEDTYGFRGDGSDTHRVRRVACRIWANGSFGMPTKESAAPLSPRAKPPTPEPSVRAAAQPPAPVNSNAQVFDEDVEPEEEETGF